MKLAIAGAPHLGYCTNIHPGERWSDVRRVLAEHVTRVKRRVCPDAPFGVGLRLSAAAAEELAEGDRVRELHEWLEAEGLYVFTINGFPYGTFHEARVKEGVYLPDWLDDARLAYSERLAGILAELLPDGVDGSISTVPGAYKPRERCGVTDEPLRDRTGKRIALALEPEPCCQLETVAESIAFFEERLFPRGEALVREHLGICLDACHMAVEYETPGGTLDAFASRGIRIPKIQLSAGLEVRPEGRPRDALLAALARFDEPVYLHQVIEEDERGGVARRWTDLGDALAAARAGSALERRWRIHFHVPLFREELGVFHGTQPWLSELLGRLRTDPASPHLEVETYTWDVLPEEHRGIPIDDAIARELEWVLDALGARA